MEAENILIHKLGNKNIYLYGPPGSGKTYISQILSKRLNMPSYDIDDDHLEILWGCTVGEKLSEVGDEEFIKLEGSENYS
jgi:shikimate kinase